MVCQACSKQFIILILILDSETVSPLQGLSKSRMQSSSFPCLLCHTLSQTVRPIGSVRVYLVASPKVLRMGWLSLGPASVWEG